MKPEEAQAWLLEQLRDLCRRARGHGYRLRFDGAAHLTPVGPEPISTPEPDARALAELPPATPTPPIASGDLCASCGAMMRPDGSCQICTGCGSRSGGCGA